MFVIIENNKVVTTNVDNTIFKVAVEAPDDIVFGDEYIDSKWIRCGDRPKPNILTPSEQRSQGYIELLYREDGEPLIVYQGQNLTVEQCRRELDFYIYDKEKGDSVRSVLLPQYNLAKEYIRGLYPD